jgi:hypothetical protein
MAPMPRIEPGIRGSRAGPSLREFGSEEPSGSFNLAGASLVGIC